MSQAGSNLCLSLPALPCGRTSNSSKPLCSTIAHSFKPIGRRLSQNNIRATATGENRDNLDYLQRPSNLQQSSPKKRVTPVAPLGLQKYCLCLIIESLKKKKLLSTEIFFRFFSLFCYVRARMHMQGCGTDFQRQGRCSR